MVNDTIQDERLNRIKEHLALYFVMGSMNAALPLPDVLQQAIAGGVTIFQYREKGAEALQGEQKVEMAKQLLALCQNHHIPFIVNDDVDLAIEIGADGVHIGQEDGDVRAVRKKIGDQMWLGVSAHDADEALLAVQAGADYLGVGPMYATTTKPDVRPVQGPGVIRQIRSVLPNVPLVGIGGIQTENVQPVIEAGADGAAVISAISQAADPQLAARELKRAIVQRPNR